MASNNTHQQSTRIARIVAGAMLLLALGSWQYGYFQLLRVVVCGVGLYSGWYFLEIKQPSWAWFFFLTAVLFNPIVIVSLQKSTWQLLDLAVGAVFLISLSVQGEKGHDVLS